MINKLNKKLIIKSIGRSNSFYKIARRKNLLYKHNIKPYYNIVKSFNSGNKRAAIVHAVGTGKSFLAMQWLHDELTGGVVFSNAKNENPLFISAKNKVKVLYLSSKRASFGQIKRNAEEVGKPELIEYIVRETYAGLLMKFKKSYGNFDLEILDSENFELPNTETEFTNYIKQFTHVILDEFHHADENKWGAVVKQALQINSKAKVLGLTATPIRSTGTNTVESLFKGNVVSTISLADAIVDEILPMPNYVISVYSYEKLLKRYDNILNKVVDKTKKKEATRMVDEIKGLITKSQGAKELITSTFKINPNGKYIIFCDDIKTSKLYMKDIENIANEAGFKNSILFNVNASNPNSESDINKFNKLKGTGLKLLFAVDMLNESVHISNIDGVIMMRDTNSYIVYHQQLGRALAVGNGKRPVVLDLVDNINSAFEYRQDKKGLTDLFAEVAERTTNPEIKVLAMQAINENEIMQKLQKLDEYIGIETILIDEKLDIIKQLLQDYQAGKIKQGITKSAIGYRISNSFIYKGYRVGMWINWAKHQKVNGNNSNRLIIELEHLGIDLNKYRQLDYISNQEKLEIIAEIIEIFKIEPQKVKFLSLNNGKYKFTNSATYNGYKVGSWIGSIKFGSINSSELEQGLINLNVDLSIKEIETTTAKEKINIIRYAIEDFKQGKKIEGLTVFEGKYKFKYNCVYNGYKIGEWISRRNFQNFDIEELENLNVFLKQSSKVITWEEKVEILKQAIETWKRGISVPGISLKNGLIQITNKCVFNNYSIGTWVHNINSGQTKNVEFIKAVKLLNINANLNKSDENFKHILKIIKEAIDNNAEGITILEDGKVKINYNCVYKGVKIGLKISRVKKGLTTNKTFIDGLNNLNVIIDTNNNLTVS